MNVVRYCRNVLHAEELFFLGHSISGQILPLAENANEFSAAYLVASQCVDRNNWSGRSRLAVNFFWSVSIPLATAIFNYLPAWTYGAKRHLSRSVARDWARLAKTSGGVAKDNAYNNGRYLAYNVRTKFLSIAGDHLLAPKKAVSDLYAQYGTTAKAIKHLDAPSHKRVDHFTFFKKINSDLWIDIQDWFDQPDLNEVYNPGSFKTESSPPFRSA